MKTNQWTRVSVICAAAALIGGWQAVVALAGNPILGSGKLGTGKFQIGNQSQSGMKLLQVSPNFGKAFTQGSSGPQKLLLDPNFGLAKPSGMAQIDPKFNLKTMPLVKINPNLLGKLKPMPLPDPKPLPKDKWPHPGHKHPIWPGLGYYGSHYAGYYDYGPTYVSSGYSLPPANVLPSAPMRVAVENPAGTGASIQFVVDGQAASLEPGQRIEIGELRPRVIEFHRGGEFGLARYSVQEGTYSFAVSSQGIELYHEAYRAQ